MNRTRVQLSFEDAYPPDMQKAFASKYGGYMDHGPGWIGLVVTLHFRLISSASTTFIR
jgi:hypothetical protein